MTVFVFNRNSYIECRCIRNRVLPSSSVEQFYFSSFHFFSFLNNLLLFFSFSFSTLYFSFYEHSSFLVLTSLLSIPLVQFNIESSWLRFASHRIMHSTYGGEYVLFALLLMVDIQHYACCKNYTHILTFIIR